MPKEVAKSSLANCSAYGSTAVLWSATEQHIVDTTWARHWLLGCVRLWISSYGTEGHGMVHIRCVRAYRLVHKCVGAPSTVRKCRMRPKTVCRVVVVCVAIAGIAGFAARTRVIVGAIQGSYTSRLPPGANVSHLFGFSSSRYRVYLMESLQRKG